MIKTNLLKTFLILAITFSVGAVLFVDKNLFDYFGKTSTSSIVAVQSICEQKICIDVKNTTQSQILSRETFVDLGSITKFVTAVAILHLVDEGRLTLHEPLRQIIPNVPQDKALITVHQLLTHTSGLVESTGTDEEKLDRNSFLKRVLSTPLIHKPGKKYFYSDAGYSLLAAIIELRSNKDYELYLLENILKPRNLPEIGYQTVYTSNQSMRSFRTWRTLFQNLPIHSASWGGEKPWWNLIGNGGAVSTAEGFLRFWHAFLQGKIVSPQLVTLALRPHADEGNARRYYGYGLVVEQSPEFGKIYWHDGGNEVFSAEWRHLARKKITIFSAGPSEEGFKAMKAMIKTMRQKKTMH